MPWVEVGKTLVGEMQICSAGMLPEGRDMQSVYCAA
jgi:hypothetical protein